MKKYFLFVLFSFLLTGLLFAKSKDSKKKVANKPSGSYTITSSFFNEAQRPLGHPLQNGFYRVDIETSRLLLLGCGGGSIEDAKKVIQAPFNGCFSKTTVKGEIEIRELHSLGNSSSTVELVYFIFSSKDKSELDRLKSEFESEADKVLGTREVNGDATVLTWEHSRVGSFLVNKGINDSWCYLVFFQLNSWY